MRLSRIQYFDTEGRDNLPSVIKQIRHFLKSFRLPEGGFAPERPSKIVFMTFRGEGPLLGYHELFDEDVSIIAVLFPPTYRVVAKDGAVTCSEIPEKIEKFFAGVGIPILRTRLPLDEITGADGHNREMGLVKKALGLFGGSIPLAVQAVLQATDGGYVKPGEQVIAATSDTALCMTAATSKDFLTPSGIQINEILCKPRRYTIARPVLPPPPKPQSDLTLAASADPSQERKSATIIDMKPAADRPE